MGQKDTPWQTFTPSGGMNQDDSMVTPTRDYAGRNAFTEGDYKYALNSRIGSSRSDNFGDLEILKGTSEVDTYYVRGIVNTNSNFSSGLTGWTQQSVTGGIAWVSSSGASFQYGAGSSVSDILYQYVSPVLKRMGIRIKLSIGWITETASISIVFLNGSFEVISSQTIITDANDGTASDHSYSKYINLELPLGTNIIGVQAYATTLLIDSIVIQNFEFFDWVIGSRPVDSETNEIVIGKLYNQEFNLLYYHVYNSSEFHCIRAYDPINNIVLEILRWAGLNYDPLYFESVAMVDNFMAWTGDGFNAPRLIDVHSIGDLLLILGTDFREYHISFHRWAPTMPPILKAYYDGSTNNYKKFEGKSIQFSHRYIYQNKMRSRWSPISVAGQNFRNISGIQVTYIEILIPGFTLDDPNATSTAFNYFNNDDIKFTSVVESIEIGFRESDLDPWKILQRYQVRGVNNLLFKYTGDSNSTPIPTDDFYQLFDTVPFMAGTVESIDNRFVFADILDEKTTAPPVQVTDIGVVKFDNLLTLDHYWDAGSNVPVDNAALFSGMSAGDADELGKRNYISDMTFKGRGKYKLGIQWIAESGWRSAVYTNDTWIYDIQEETGVIDKIYALTFKFPDTFRPPDWAVAYQIVRTNCLNIDYFLFGAANSFTFLRDDPTATSDATVVPQAIQTQAFNYFENARSVAGLELNAFEGVLKKKSFAKAMAAAVRKTVTTATITAASRIYIDINNWYNASAANNPQTQDNPLNNLFYNYREGDRVRFLASSNATPSSSDKVVYDLPILEFHGKGLVVEKPSGIAWLPGGTNTIASNYLIEVYTPKIPQQADYVYYECGEWYPILYPFTNDRQMSKRDWTFTLTTDITCDTYGDIKVFSKKPFSYGDCHNIGPRLFYFNIVVAPLVPAAAIVTSIYSSSMNPLETKSWDYWEKNNGRAALAYTDFPSANFIGTKARFTGQIVEQSFINQLNRMRDEDQKVYPSEYGRIRYLVTTANAQVESVGTILLAIGERETFSIYVNRTTLEDLSGNTQVALSDKVLGSYNTLLGSHGTINPESVTLDRGHVYYWDNNNGCWIRYGRDGLTEISGYKMRNWFKELSALLEPRYVIAEKPKVISEFDTFNEELITAMNHSLMPPTFRGYTTYKGAIFSEVDKRWKTIHSYNPEMFGRTANKLISFYFGGVYVHEESDTRLTFYGLKNDAMIEPVFTTMKDQSVYEAIATVSSHKWSVESMQSEYRGVRNKRESRIPLGSFEYKEDHYEAAIKRDINTVNGGANPIITGDLMRSKAVKALLKLDPSITTESLLQYVEIRPIDSARNP